jgi:uncharacterized NAD-dependent epimerase/dehydratase family protein
LRNAAPRRYAILAPNHFRENAKTAHGVIRYGTDETVAVVDPSCAGMRIRDAVPYLHSDAPIVASVAEALTFGPTALLIGTAPKGGRLPPSWRAEIAAAIAGGLEIVSGLHDMLADDPQFARAALEAGTKIWDVRKPPDVPIFSGAAYDVASPIVLAVGSDCAVGKMTVMLELSRAARSNGREATFVPTGQTGIMIAGWGIAVDRVIADFATGAAEQLVLAAAQHEPSCILVEGQGGINNPAYAPVTLALLFGAAPDALVLVADVRRRHIESFGTPILSYRHLIRAYESLCATVKPAQVVAIALNTHGVDEDAAHSEIARARTETGIFADDVVRFGPEALWAAVERSLVKRAPLRAEMAAG